MIRQTLLVLLFVAGCSKPALPARASQDPAPVAEPIPPTTSTVPTSTSAVMSAPPPPVDSTTGAIWADTAMPLGGSLNQDTLIAALNRQMGPLEACVSLIRNTDQVVGSLNVQVTVSADGKVKAELQSPVNAEAEKCLGDKMDAWSLPGRGEGEAMVLLILNETLSSASANPSEPRKCPPVTAPPGYVDCFAFELTGGPPCESICRKPRKTAPKPCCPDPQHSVVLSGNRELLALPTCQFVPPDCAHRHGHGNMDSTLRILKGPPPEVMVVEGGCEMRAMSHGYVPSGVPAWAGCRRQTYRWDGQRFVKQSSRSDSPARSHGSSNSAGGITGSPEAGPMGE